MQYFTRFISTPDQAEADLNRGHSFYGYTLYSSYESAIDSDAIEFGWFTEDDIASIEIDGIEKFGFALAGLSGFGGFDTIEEAQARAAEGFGVLQHVVIFEGSYIDADPDGVGVLFRPIRIMEVI